MSTDVATILVPAAVAVIGAFIYLIAGGPSPPASANSGKFSEMGRIAFFVGLFWLVAVFAHAAVHL